MDLISTLQPELLSEILIHAVFSSESESESPSTPGSESISLFPNHPLHNALLLASVSRTWRAVAHSTPSLWSSLGLNSVSFRRVPVPIGSHPNRYHIFPKIEWVEKWVERSGACPLDLTMCLTRLGTRREPDREAEERVVELVTRNRGRIRSFRIVTAPFSKLGFRVLDALVPVPKLEVLIVRFLNRTPRDFVGTPVLTMPHSDRLVELGLYLAVDTALDVVFPARPFERLRSLTIETKQSTWLSLPTDRVLDMLDACSLTLDTFSWDTPVLSPLSSGHLQKHITLPSLTSFLLTIHIPSSPLPFLSLLTLPSLTSLHLDVLPDEDLPLAFPPGILSRSLCPTTGKTKLEDIYIETDVDLPLLDVQEILRISPALKTFCFTVPLTEELAAALLSDSGSEQLEGDRGTTLAPHVHHMEFSWEGNFVLLVDAFAAMVLSRWGGPSGLFPGKGALKSVRVSRVQEGEKRVMYAHPGLKDCIEEGFRLELSPF